MGLVNEVNERHLVPWAAVCSAGGLENTPLTPYLDQDAVHHHHLHLDGSKLRAEGFTYSVPKPTKELLVEVRVVWNFCDLFRLWGILVCVCVCVWL